MSEFENIDDEIEELRGTIKELKRHQDGYRQMRSAVNHCWYKMRLASDICSRAFAQRICIESFEIKNKSPVGLLP